MMQILDLLGMYFDAAVVFVTNFSLLFRLAMAILCMKAGQPLIDDRNQVHRILDSARAVMAWLLQLTPRRAKDLSWMTIKNCQSDKKKPFEQAMISACYTALAQSAQAAQRLAQAAQWPAGLPAYLWASSNATCLLKDTS